MDAIELLVRQHREMEAAMKEVLAATDEDAISQFADVGDQLTLHLASEEEVFYPAVKVRRTEDILLESLEEHLSLKRLLADLLDMAPGDKTFEAKFKVLKEQAEHHHKEEEEHLFPKVHNLLDADARRALGEQMLALQRRRGAEEKPREAVVDQTDAAASL